MKSPRVNFRRILLLLSIVAAVAAFFFFAVIPSHKAWAHARTLSDALTNARSVTIVEFERGFSGPELVFSRGPASPRDIAAFRTAIGAWYSPIPRGRATCFKPHHRVEIVRADGSVLRFEVCFHCRNFTLDDSDAVTLPTSWHDRLAQFFASVGMPPRGDYSALAKSHPDFHLVEEARRESDRQIEQLINAPQK